jgi:hypothetical protein
MPLTHAHLVGRQLVAAYDNAALPVPVGTNDFRGRMNV